MGNNLVRVIESEREKGTVEMNLSQRSILELPPEIGLLTNLKRLKLDGNQLTRIPFEITYLSNLQYLNLKSNSLKEFPEALCYMQRLEILDISKNQIKSLPEDFGRLKNTLKAFSISKNRLQEIPPYISEMNELKILKIEFNPIEYPPQNIINCPPDMPQDVWLNRLKDFLRQDEKNGNPKITNNENKSRHSKNLESHIREAASINDCDILCDTYFHNVPRLTHDMDKLDPWVYYFVESARNLIYAIAQLCRAIKQYSPTTTNPKIHELFEKEYGDVNRKVCQIIYSLDRFDRGISEPSLHRRLCSDLKLIVMTTIPDVKKLLISIQSNLKLLMENTNIRVSRNFLFTCHSVIVEVHAATESVLMAIPASERNLNPISTPMTRSSSSISIPSLMNHKYSNSKSSMTSILNAMNSKSANTSSSSTVVSTSLNNENNNDTSQSNISHKVNKSTGAIPINGTALKTSMSSSLNDLSMPISTSQTSNSSMKNIYQKANSETNAEPLNITGTSLTESFTGVDVGDSATSSYNDSMKSFNISQSSVDNTNSSISAAAPYAISKQQNISENALHHPSQLSQQLNIETQIRPRKDSLNSMVTNTNESNSVINQSDNSTINASKNRNILNANSSVASTSITTTPTPGNVDNESNRKIINNNSGNGNPEENNLSLNSLERRIRHKSSLSASSSTAIVGIGNEVFNNNELSSQPLATPPPIQSVPSTSQAQTPSQPTLPMEMGMNMNMGMGMGMPLPMNGVNGVVNGVVNGMNGMNGIVNGVNGVVNGVNGMNIRNNDDTVSVYSASSLPSALNMTIVPQPSIASSRLNNLQNLSLTYELKEFNFPLEEQFFILSFASLRASYACLEILKMNFDALKASSPVMENPEIYQLIVDCSGPPMDTTRVIVDNYYEKFLACVNYTVTGGGTAHANTHTNINANSTTDITNEMNQSNATAATTTTTTTTHTTSGSLIPIKTITLSNTNIINPNSTSEDHRTIYEDSIEYIHSLIQYTIIIREMTQRINFNRNVIVALQNVTKSTKNLVKFCSK